MTAPHRAEAEARENVLSAVNNIGWVTQADSLDLVPDLLAKYRDAVAARVRAECEADRLVMATCNGHEVPVDAKRAFEAVCVELVKVHAARDAAYARGRADTLAEVRGIVEGKMPQYTTDDSVFNRGARHSLSDALIDLARLTPAPAPREVTEDEKLLLEANGILRSMNAVVKREMNRVEGPMLTHWDGLGVRLELWLRESHDRTNVIRGK